MVQISWEIVFLVRPARRSIPILYPPRNKKVHAGRRVKGPPVDLQYMYTSVDPDLKAVFSGLCLCISPPKAGPPKPARLLEQAVSSSLAL